MVQGLGRSCGVGVKLAAVIRPVAVIGDLCAPLRMIADDVVLSVDAD
jgi:hypothetical protein